MSELQLPEPHSIEALVASVAIRGAAGQEAISFDDDAIETIAEAVDEIPDSVELVDAVNTLVAIAHALEVETKAPIAAKQILAIVERQNLLDRLSELLVQGGVAQREALEKSAEKMSGGGAESSGQIAHNLAQPAPTGAVKLSALVPSPMALTPQRPRPPAPKPAAKPPAPRSRPVR